MQTHVDYIAILMFLLFAGFGLFVLLAPINILSRLDRRTGKNILTSEPDAKTGARKAGIFYRIFGAIFVIIAVLNFVSRWPVVYSGDRSKPAAEIYVQWVRDAKAASEGDKTSRLARSIPYFPDGTRQVYVNFYTSSPTQRPMLYRWFVDQRLHKEFMLNYENGRNLVPLNGDGSSRLPVGEHEVYMTSDGVSVALVRFRVVGSEIK
jgi:hypothetical protein